LDTRRPAESAESSDEMAIVAKAAVLLGTTMVGFVRLAARG
jgi:hypothetical protein